MMGAATRLNPKGRVRAGRLVDGPIQIAGEKMGLDQLDARGAARACDEAQRAVAKRVEERKIGPGMDQRFDAGGVSALGRVHGGGESMPEDSATFLSLGEFRWGVDRASLGNQMFNRFEGSAVGGPHQRSHAVAIEVVDIPTSGLPTRNVGCGDAWVVVHEEAVVGKAWMFCHGASRCKQVF